MTKVLNPEARRNLPKSIREKLYRLGDAPVQPPIDNEGVVIVGDYQPENLRVDRSDSSARVSISHTHYKI